LANEILADLMILRAHDERKEVEDAGVESAAVAGIEEASTHSR